MSRRPDPSTDVEDDGDGSVVCPYCESTDTDREHPKGPSLCRSMHYCNDCGEAFEAFG